MIAMYLLICFLILCFFFYKENKKFKNINKKKQQLEDLEIQEKEKELDKQIFDKQNVNNETEESHNDETIEK